MKPLVSSLHNCVIYMKQ